MLRIVVSLVLLAGLLAAVARPAAAVEPQERVVVPQTAVLQARMVGHSLRVTVATAGFAASEADQSTLTVSAWFDGAPIRATLPLIEIPSRLSLELDLRVGAIRIGGVTVGDFPPVAPFRENLRFPVEVTVRRGALAATARATVTTLLPVVIVPGYLNEWSGPSHDVLAAFERRGYTVSGPRQNVFWFTYPSQQVTVPAGAAALAAYVRAVVLPATHAARVSVVGYSLGGLMARWNVAYDVDGWATLVNRLVLVGVPNEGTVLAYVVAHAPSIVPYSGLGRRPAASAFLPTFPFWRADSTQPWTVPADAGNELLADLNAQPLPSDIRLYLFYGSHDPRHAAGPQTSAGLTGSLPGATLSYGEGDGVVLAASAQGLPIGGGDGVTALTEHAAARIDLGAVYHTGLLEAGATKIVAALLDYFFDRVDGAAALPTL